MCVISIIVVVVVVVEPLNWIYINIDKYSRAHTVQKEFLFCEGTSSMLKTIFYCMQTERELKWIYMRNSMLPPDDVMTCFFISYFTWCIFDVSVQEMSNKWQILATVFIPISFHSLRARTNQTQNNIFQSPFPCFVLELKIHTFAELLARRDFLSLFFSFAWKTKGSIFCALLTNTQHLTLD